MPSAVSFDDLPDAPATGKSAVSFDDLPDVEGQSDVPSDAVAAAIPGSAGDAARARYNTSSLGRLDNAIGDALLSNKMSPEYAAEEAGSSLPSIRRVPLIGPLAANIAHGGANLFSSGANAVDDARTLGYQDRIKNGPLVATGHLLGAAALGIPGAAYNVVNPIANTIETGVKAAGSDALRLVGQGDAATNFEAQKDRDRMDVRQGEESVLGSIHDLSPNAPITSAIENTAPFLVPAGIGLQTDGLAARVGNRVEAALAPKAVAPLVGSTAPGIASRIGSTVLDHVPIIGPVRKVARAVGDLSDAIKGGETATPGLRAPNGPKLPSSYVPMADRAAQEATLAANLDGSVGRPLIGKYYSTLDQATDAKALGQIANVGINAVAPIAAGAVIGAGSADPGQEMEGARSGASMGALAAPVTAIAGGYARQRIEQAAANQQLAAAGARRTVGTDLLSPENAQAVNAIQGHLLNPDINKGRGQITVLSPEDYAQSVQDLTPTAAFSDDNNAGKAESRGYHIPETGQIVLNAKPAGGFDLGAALHETGHALPAILNGITPGSGDAFSRSLAKTALTDNAQPTPDFQKLLDSYSGEPIDWTKLSDAEKQGYLDEYGAQTALAQGGLLNPGQYALKPEFSDLVHKGLANFGRSAGLTQSPNLLNLLSSDYAPANSSALDATDAALRTIGSRERSGILPPVVPDAIPATRGYVMPSAEPVPSSLSIAPRPANTTPVNPRPLVREIAPVQPVRSPVMAGGGSSLPELPAGYNDALTLATLPKKMGGLGLSQSDATTRLDNAADAGVISAEDLLFHAQTGRLPDPRTAPARGVAPAQETAQEGAVPQPADEAAAQSEVATQPRLPESTLPTRPEASTEVASPTANVGAPEASNEQSEQVSSPDPTTPSTPVAIPFTAADEARIRQEVAATFKPKNENKTNGTAAEQLATAQTAALRHAHAAALPEGDTRVQQRVDPDTGRTVFSGQSLVPGDPLHDPALAKLNDTQKGYLGDIQNAIASGRALDMDYNSAARQRLDPTNAQRIEAQDASPSAARAKGQAPIEEQKGKAIVPYSLSIGKDGSTYMTGVSIDKFLGNANKAGDLLSQMGHPNPYPDINAPEFLQDVQGYFQNHNNGYGGDGKTALKGTEAIPVGSTPDNYQPYQLDRTKADFINLALAQEGAKAQQGGKGNKSPTVAAQRVQDFAKLNGITPTEAGEVNNLRQAVNDSGNFTVGEDTGTKNVLEDPLHETVRLDNITGLRQLESMGADPSNFRSQGFSGDRGAVVANGLPSAKKAAAGFLPAYHASPYQFEQFDLNKAGTGEGNDAYGHGIYLAQDPNASGPDGYYTEAFRDEHGHAHSYHVDLDAEPHEILDRDTPVSQQGDNIKKIAATLPPNLNEPGKFETDKGTVYIERQRGGLKYSLNSEPLTKDQATKLVQNNETGTGLYLRLADHLYQDGQPESAYYKNASEYLKNNGVPALSYLDDVSRQNPDGPQTKNFVVFDGGKIKILQRNGAPVDNASPDAGAGASFLPSVTLAREQAIPLRNALQSKADQIVKTGGDASDLTTLARALKGGSNSSLWAMMRTPADEQRFQNQLSTLASKYNLDLSGLEPVPQPTPPTPFSFAQQVRQAADASPKAMSDGRVYIADAYDAYKQQGGTLSLDQFKAQLNLAHQAGDVGLGRKDLGTNDPAEQAKVQRSLTERLGEKFHFIRPQ
jgi:hypothetical protein